MLKRFPTDRAFLEHVVTNPVEVDQWQLEKLALVTTEKQLLFYVPKLAAEYQDCLWGKAFPTIESALAATVDGLTPGTRIAVIPEGPYVLARAAEGVAAARG